MLHHALESPTSSFSYYFFFRDRLTTGGGPTTGCRNCLAPKQRLTFSGFRFVKHAKVNFLRAGLKRSLHILDSGIFNAKNVWNKSQTVIFSAVVGLKNVIICLQLEPNHTWTLSGGHLINAIINLNLLPQTTNKAKFSLRRHKSGTDCVVWHWSLHTGSQAAIFPPTRPPVQSQAAPHVMLPLRCRRSWRSQILMFAKDALMRSSWETNLDFLTLTLKCHIKFIPSECFAGFNYIILASAARDATCQ